MPLKNPKAKGSRNERRTRDYYLERGATHVIKAAGSLGMLDLVAFKDDECLLIQVKSNRPPSRKEMETLRTLVPPPYCRKYLVVWKDYQREPIISPVQ